MHISSDANRTFKKHRSSPEHPKQRTRTEPLSSEDSEYQTTDATSGLAGLRGNRFAVAAMVLLFLTLVSLTAWRAYSNLSPPSVEFDWGNRGFSDFHNGTYFPTKAFIDGKSPYSGAVAQEYSLARETPPYSPIVFIIHIPFALLPIEIARGAFFVYSLGVLGALAFCSLRMARQSFRWFDFLAIWNLLLLSRPGHLTLFTGYFTAEIVLGCVLALHFATKKPWLSGLALVLASIKPNFVLPLILMMLFARNFKAVAWGILFCAITAGAGVGWLSHERGFASVFEEVQSGQKALHVEPTEMPVNTWTRLDLTGMFAKVINWAPGDSVYLVVMAIMLVAVGLLVLRKSPGNLRGGAASPQSLFICVGVLLSIYHHVYDCLLIAVPAVALVLYREKSYDQMPAKLRGLLKILVVVPAVNYLSTLSVMGLLEIEKLSFAWQAITLINGICLLMAFTILAFYLVSQGNREQSPPN